MLPSVGAKAFALTSVRHLAFKAIELISLSFNSVALVRVSESGPLILAYSLRDDSRLSECAAAENLPAVVTFPPSIGPDY